MSGSGFHVLVCAIFCSCLILQNVLAAPKLAKGRLEMRKTKDENQNDLNKGSELDRVSTYVACSADPVNITEKSNIQSPHYPDNYPNDVSCHWNIFAGEDESIRIKFNSFDLEYHRVCDFDVLLIYTRTEAYRFCGDQHDETYAPEQIIFPNEVRDAQLMFISDHTTTSSGFDVTVSLDGNDACSGGTVVAVDSTIISPGYPNGYPNNAYCDWRIYGPPNKVVKLVVQDFMLENQEFCTFDALEITGGRQLITGCGMYPDDNVLPDALAFPTNQIRIVFRSDASFNRPGFSLDVIFQDYCSDVPFMVIESGTVITSPGFPDQSYPVNLSCTWNIKAPTGYAIDVKFSHFDLEDHFSCDYDYLELQGSDPTPSKFCGSSFSSNAAPQHQGFATNEISIRFVSDYSNSYGGFGLEVIFNEMIY